MQLSVSPQSKGELIPPGSLESQEKARRHGSQKAGEMLPWLVRNVCVKGERCKWTPSLSVEQSSQTLFYWSVAPAAVTSNPSHTRRWKSGACSAFELRFCTQLIGGHGGGRGSSILSSL